MELPAPLPPQVSFSLHPPLTFVLCILLSKEGVCKCTGDCHLWICSNKCLSLLASKQEKTEGKEAIQNAVIKQNNLTENGNVSPKKKVGQPGNLGHFQESPLVKQVLRQRVRLDTAQMNRHTPLCGCQLKPKNEIKRQKGRQITSTFPGGSSRLPVVPSSAVSVTLRNQN